MTRIIIISIKSVSVAATAIAARTAARAIPTSAAGGTTLSISIITDENSRHKNDRDYNNSCTDKNSGRNNDVTETIPPPLRG